MSPTLNITIWDCYKYIILALFTYHILRIHFHQPGVASFSDPPSIQLLTGYKGKAWSVFSHEMMFSQFDREGGGVQASLTLFLVAKVCPNAGVLNSAKVEDTWLVVQNEECVCKTCYSKLGSLMIHIDVIHIIKWILHFF